MPHPLQLKVDRRSLVPLYHQVAQQLEEAILSGQLAPGYKLENEIALADRLGLSRPTMRRGIQELVDRGLLVRKRGVGTQVVHGRVRRELELTSLFDDLSSTGQAPTTKVLANRVEAASAEVAEELGLAEGEEVRYLERLRAADGKPLAVMRNWLPAHVISPSDEDLETEGLYQLLRDAGHHIQIARQVISARGASAKEAQLLDRRRNDALLTMQRTAYTDAGLAVELGKHCYRPEAYAFEVTLVGR